MAMKFHEVDGYAASIAHDLTLADRAREAGDLQLVAEPSLSIVCFLFAPDHLWGDEDGLNRLNQRLLEAAQLGGDAFPSSTTIRGAFCLRACVINHRTTARDVDFRVDHVRQIGRELVVAHLLAEPVTPAPSA